MSETTPAPRAYVLGAELRDARERAGLGLRQLAKQLDLSHSVVVRWERGERVPSPESVSGYLAVLGVSSSERDRILDMTREAEDEPVNSVSVGIGGMHDLLTALLEFERTATAITDVSPLLIPGLLQTSDYVRAIMGSGLPESEIDTRATLRVGRRDLITNPRSRTMYSAFIGEGVLHQPIGSDEVLAEQLRYVNKVGELDNVDIRVIPRSAGWTPAHAGPFLLLEFAKATPVVHLEHHRSSAFLRDKGDVDAYEAAVQDVRRVAMSPEESAELIAEVANKMERT
jgi:transcriptional regulator with XRE-family HTH domain